MAGTTRLDDESAQHAEGVLVPRGMAVECVAAFLRVRTDIPLELLGLARGHEGVRVIAGCRLPGGLDQHLRAVDDHIGWLAVDLILEGDAHAVALIRANRKRLDEITLQAI